jgi:hypothetical protein
MKKNCEVRNVSEVERLASNVIELSTRYNFTFWLAIGSILRGWARCSSGDTAEGIPLIEDGIREYHAPGSMLGMSFYLAVKAEALHLADRTSEALAAIEEAKMFTERLENYWWSAELYRLRGVFLADTGADEAQIDTSFREAISIANEQKSILLKKRAEATYAEYRSRRGIRTIGGRGGDEGPAHEGGCEPSARACADEYEALRADRSAGVRVDDAYRDGEDARVPRSNRQTPRTFVP